MRERDTVQAGKVGKNLDCLVSKVGARKANASRALALWQPSTSEPKLRLYVHISRGDGGFGFARLGMHHARSLL